MGLQNFDGNQTTQLHSCLVPQTTKFQWMEMVISNHFSMVMIWNHHPIETLPLKSGCLEFQV